jgi:hypothetical protein
MFTGRAITRSEQNEYIEKLKRTQFILSGWEPTEIRQQQLSDEIIGCIMAAIETGKDRPAWESVSSGTSQLKTLWSPTKYDPNGALFFCLFGFLAKHLSHWRQ